MISDSSVTTLESLGAEIVKCERTTEKGGPHMFVALPDHPVYLGKKRCPYCAIEDRDSLYRTNQTLRNGNARQSFEIEQILGRALGYPRYADDQKNFPNSTDEDGVCVGEHVPETIAVEAANKILKLNADMQYIEDEIKRLRDSVQATLTEFQAKQAGSNKA